MTKENTVTLDAINSDVKGIASAISKQAEQSQEVKAGFEATKAEMKNLHESVEKQQKQLDELMSAVQQSGARGEKRERAELDIKYNKLFGSWMSGRAEARDLHAIAGEYKSALIEVATKNGDFKAVEELKTLSTDAHATGGALVPVQMANRIVEKQRDFSDIRPYATIERSDTTGLILPGEAADFGFGWVGERETRTTADNGEFQDIEIPVMEARCKVPITNKMRLNSAFDMDSYITRKAAYRLSRGEAAAFVIGDGVKKPLGFMTYAAGTGAGQVQQVTTATANTITHEDLTDVKTPLRGVYRRNARFFMNRFTQGYIEKLDDGQGNPLFNRGNLAQAIPDAIKGYPITLLDDMAGANETTGVLASNALVVLYADLSEFYTIVDHTTSMLMYIDPYSDGDSGKVNFRFHKFVGGGVSNFEAGKILKIKA